MRDALRLAVGTLTTVPTAPPRRVDSATAGSAMLLAPLTAVPLAVVAVGAHLLVSVGALPSLVAAALLLGLTALWSRGLHLDGLADSVDGWSAGSDHDRALEVMRRGDVGPTGVVALVMVLLVQFGALVGLLTTRGGTVLVAVALVASRWVLAGACWRGIPAARPAGLGATVAGSVSTLRLAAATSIMLGVAVALPALAATRWYASVLVLVAAALGAAWVVVHAVRQLGGITGDTLGAAVETALAAALVTGSVLV